MLREMADEDWGPSRVCGETDGDVPVWVSEWGPSPRVRGNPRAAVGRVLRGGSIPACAGKPSSHHRHSIAIRVHPRVCGETHGRARGAGRSTGPSPRVRGNHDHRRGDRACCGSIPACAGKPATGPARTAIRRVHPRVCGETCGVTTPARPVSGPSPRVRGNRATAAAVSTGRGSIPACAGKPACGRGRGR